MAKNLGLNLGPMMGPLAPKRPEPISGRWVSIKRYEGGNTNPLQGGHWEDGGYWVDPPTEWGGGGIDPVGGGGTSFYTPFPPPPPPPPPNSCPAWTPKPVTGGMEDQDTCTADQKNLLKYNYSYLIGQMASYLAQFIDQQGYSLLECIKDKWCTIQISCDDPGDDLGGIFLKNTEPVPTLILSPRYVTKPADPKDIDPTPYYLLFGLIAVCGGSFLDQVVISSYDPNRPEWPGWIDIDRRREVYIPKLIDDTGVVDVDDPSVPGGKRRLILGRWVWWDRDNGDVGVVPEVNNILNKDRNAKDISKKRWRF